MNYQFSFEKLQVWQDARELTTIIYKTTSKFPTTEQFGLTKQLRRASISVASNIAEGSGRFSFKDQAHFYQMAYSSLLEVLNQLIIAFDLQFLHENDLQDQRAKIHNLSIKLNALRKSRLYKKENTE